MNLIAVATSAVEHMPLPDALARAGIAAMVGRTSRKLAALASTTELAFVEAMRERPIAMCTEDANSQHYDLPPAFFGQVLGPRRKYSCGYYPDDRTTLGQGEECALALTAAHGMLRDGQDVLELGCGWGSLSLWMAERYPASRIVAVSNSRPQRIHIEDEAARRGLTNLSVYTSDMNVFETDRRFDRVVSVEMFEHMSNWPALLRRIDTWLRPDGRLFLHVFSHRKVPYRFDHADKADWIAQNFFTGGIMPSHNLIRHVSAPFVVEADWRWPGTHYARTARDWLRRYDANRDAIAAILKTVYGGDWLLWRRRWRLFFLATSGLFGADGGREWGVSHYRLAKR
jgi:cyclopropane-fatty-acyl-phospholipid synthase